ncbi:translation initiation factor eIF-1A [Methanohalophilus sp.]|uniref:translation initiation factor eIF-1A n=1 Tax=Methanohalophilus sp. TaxID=1966352 RepID=UPI0026054419|nr:translation initiation factor eIF-1A [Methanohalophilus sp.]
MNNRSFNKKKNAQQDNPEQQTTKVRTPNKRKNEIIATVTALYGGKRVNLRCMDGVTRMGRIPGSKRRMRIREGDVVLIVPWEIQDSKADIIWKYRPPEVTWLQKKGFLKDF